MSKGSTFFCKRRENKSIFNMRYGNAMPNNLKISGWEIACTMSKIKTRKRCESYPRKSKWKMRQWQLWVGFNQRRSRGVAEGVEPEWLLMKNLHAEAKWIDVGRNVSLLPRLFCLNGGQSFPRSWPNETTPRCPIRLKFQPQAAWSWCPGDDTIGSVFRSLLSSFSQERRLCCC